MCTATFAFMSRVRGVMFYLDGLFVSQSNGVPPDPLLCFAVGAGGSAAGPPPGLGVKECGCKSVCVSEGTAGEGSESM